jgi:urease accessory protein
MQRMTTTGIMVTRTTIMTTFMTKTVPMITVIMVMGTIIMTTKIMNTTTATRIIRTAIAMDMRVNPAEHVSSDYATLFRLMTWLSPSFPVGAFSYSSGIEWAVETGDIINATTLQDWLSVMLTDGPGLCDGIILCHVWRASRGGDDTALADLAGLSAAFTPSRERFLETTAQGRAFVEIAKSAWDCASLRRLIAVVPGAITYPVAVGTVAAGHGLPLDLTLQAFCHAQTANWISAGVRLIPLGQTDSQRVLAALEPTINATAAKALTASLDDLGSATFRADLASMRHETQYTRLFRS